MIARIWHGWTQPEHSDAYEKLLKEEIFKGIAAKRVPGYKGIRLLRRTAENKEAEFVTIMWFDSWQAVNQVCRRRLRASRGAAQSARLAFAIRPAFTAL